MKRNVKTASLLGALTQLQQLVNNHSATLTDKSLNADSVKAAIVVCLAALQAAEQSQADAKSALKSATARLNETVNQRYPEFSSAIDLLRGAVGNNTPLGKQLTNIRKQITKRGRSKGTVNPDAVSAKIAA